MTLILHLMKALFVLLVVAFGAVSAVATSGDWTQISYAVEVQEPSFQSINLTNAARAPPTASTDVMATGIAFAQTADLRVLDGSATTGAAYALLLSSNAPNRTLTQIDTPIDLTNGRSGHILANHRAGAGKAGKTEFPANWDDQRVVHQVSDISTDPNLVRQVDNRGTPYVVGTRDGVEIRVNFFPDNHARAGQIATAYPTQ